MDDWNGLRLLNTSRTNRAALRMLNRADAAVAPNFWRNLPIMPECPAAPGRHVVALADGTFGWVQDLNPTPRSAEWLTASIPILGIHGGTAGYETLSFGGTLFGPEDRSFSASLGTVTLNRNTLEYRVRIMEPTLRGRIWVRYSLQSSNEDEQIIF